MIAAEWKSVARHPGSRKWIQFDDEGRVEKLYEHKRIKVDNEFHVSQLIYMKCGSDVFQKMQQSVPIPLRVERDYTIYTLNKKR